MSEKKVRKEDAIVSKSSSGSGASYSDITGCSPGAEPPPAVTSSPPINRKESADLEFFDTLKPRPNNMMENGSTPGNRDSLSPSPSQHKKRKPFHVFNRRGLKKSKQQSSVMSESFPAMGKSTNLTPDTGNQLSLSNTWHNSEWKEEDSLGSGMKSGSVYSSNNSLLSVESETQNLTDDEMVETLVQPQRSISWPPPLEQLHPVEVVKAEPEGGDSPDMEYLVNVTLVSGHNLAIRDRTGSSDPYVKFKCRPFKYRSAIIHRNLNPEWNEHFSFKTNLLKVQMLVRVYDHDYGSLDDFMGGQIINLAPYANDENHIIDLGLVDPAAPKNENLGFIKLYLKISRLTDKEAIMNSVDKPIKATDKKNSKSSHSRVWNSIMTVTLLEGCNLPAMDQNGLSDPYCKFKLGSQKFKSKSLSKTLNPKWMERFNLRMFDNCSTLHVEVWDKDFPQNDDFIGGCLVDLSTLTNDVTHDFTLPLVGGDGLDAEGTVHFNLCISGTKVEEEKSEFPLEAGKNKYGLLRSFDIGAIKQRNVGHFTLRIDRVMDLVPCNCFVLVELGNSCVRTQTVGKSACPIWDKTFDFTVRDIHDELEMRLYRVGHRSDQLLGMVRIPLHRLTGGSHSFMLKDKHCISRTRGILCVDTELVYQPVRAIIRTINPRETKLLEAEQKFQRKVLMNNIKRVTNLVRTIISTAELVKSVFSWENKVLSAISFLVFILVTLFGDLWMVFLAGLVMFLYQYVVIYVKNNHIWQNKVSSNVHMVNSLAARSSSQDNDGEPSDFSDLEDDKQTSIKEKFRQFQGILVIVQNILGEVADMEEGIRNFLNWRVPFLSWMAILVLLGGTVLFYLVSLRYVILVWGINKFTKSLRNPNYISNNELLDFLSCCPTHRQLEQWKDVPLVMHQKQSLQDYKAGRAGNGDSKKLK